MIIFQGKEVTCLNQVQGFTFIELLAVIAALGILVAIVFPTYEEIVEDKKQMKAKSLLFEVMHLEEEHYSEKKIYTLDLASLGYNAASHEYAEEYQVTANRCDGLELVNCVSLLAQSRKGGTDFRMKSNSDRIQAVE